MMHLTTEQLFELSRLALVRLDGAWFLALAEKMGKDAAWDVDVAAWKRFSYVIGKMMKERFLPDPVWPASFLDALEIFSTVMKIEGRSVAVSGDTITIQVTDCETQKAIAKAGVADCGIATVETYQGLARGLFGNDFQVTVSHTKNLNRGDAYCEVVISRPAA
ncbi:MAG: hypothetical protein CVU52_05820 [Deltaproteobacteria bacterium HGW-Deltaproteobacteria-10]|nr:MAG: hypothetical protein CVU52_05820 [Deltaproteobacteria bacterium HGW-Deltaproteobacteria-10]